MRAISVSSRLVLMGALALSADALSAQSEPPFIQVSGTGQVQVPSDRARLNFAVVTEGTTAAVATTENSTLMDATIRALRATNVTGLNIETGGYDLQPRYRASTEDGTQRIVGYQATNNLRVTVDDVTAVGRLLDAAVGAGTNRVTSLQFEARDTEAARTEALRRAVLNAREQAEAMASALGVPLGSAVEVHGGVQQPGPRGAFMAMDMAMARVETPIEAAESSVTAQVTIRYRLGSP
jgi:uncharacterized protein YggE